MECKYCGSNDAVKFLSLGPTPLANSFLSEEQLDDPESFYPLDVCYCRSCSAVQLGSVVDPDTLFKNYVYFSSTSITLQEHMKGLAREIDGMLPEKSFIVEIGSNDGILLQNFDQKKHMILGVDPAENVAKATSARGIPTMNAFFNADTATKIAKKHSLADVIVGTNVFAHVGDIRGFVKAVKDLLDEEGFAVFESPYLLDLMEKTEFDTIYHEHIFYLSMKPLIVLFGQVGMELFDINRTDMHGGSIRFFVKKKGSKRDIQPSVQELLALEEKKGLHKEETFHSFSSKIVNLRHDLLSLLLELKKEGKSIAGYGAPAKGNTLLNYFGIDNEILDFIADKSPHKQGLYTPGKRIPVVPVERIYEEMPDFLLILAWNFLDEIMSQLSDYQKRGGKFIVPIPGVKVIG